jgi:hypothetical protein
VSGTKEAPRTPPGAFAWILAIGIAWSVFGAACGSRQTVAGEALAEAAQEALLHGDHQRCIDLAEQAFQNQPTAHTARLLCQAYRRRIFELVRTRRQHEAQQMADRLRAVEQFLARLEAPSVLPKAGSAKPHGSAARKAGPEGRATGEGLEEGTELSAPAPLGSEGWRNRRASPATASGVSTAAPTQPALHDSDTQAPPRANERRPGLPSSAGAELLKKAEAAFRAQQFHTARPLYETAYGAAPEAFDSGAMQRWAYCRLVPVVEAINRGPANEAEWQLLEREVRDILRLLPKQRSPAPATASEGPGNLRGYTEFLLEIIRKRQAPRRRSPDMIRAAEPDTAIAPSSSREGASQLQSRSYAQAWTNQTSPRGWHPSPIPASEERFELETRNFRLRGSDRGTLERIAPQLERWRMELLRVWSLSEHETPWVPKCWVIFHATDESFRASASRVHGAPALATVQLRDELVVSRRIDVHPSATNNLEAVLRHELAHMLFASISPGAALPRWADEGLAVLSEPVNKIAEHMATVRSLERRFGSNFFAAVRLFGSEDAYPNRPAVFYGASASLVDFFISYGGIARFFEFLKRTRVEGSEQALYHVYGIPSLEELDRQWQKAREVQYRRYLGSTTDSP